MLLFLRLDQKIWSLSLWLHQQNWQLPLCHQSSTLSSSSSYLTFLSGQDTLSCTDQSPTTPPATTNPHLERLMEMHPAHPWVAARQQTKRMSNVLQKHTVQCHNLSLHYLQNRTSLLHRQTFPFLSMELWQVLATLLVVSTNCSKHLTHIRSAITRIKKKLSPVGKLSETSYYRIRKRNDSETYNCPEKTPPAFCSLLSPHSRMFQHDRLLLGTQSQIILFLHLHALQ